MNAITRATILLGCASTNPDFRDKLEDFLLSDEGVDLVELIGTTGKLHGEAANIFVSNDTRAFFGSRHPAVLEISDNIDTDGFDMRGALRALPEALAPSKTEQARLVLVHRWLTYCNRPRLQGLPPTPSPDSANLDSE